jgi:hypothetical protein
MNYSVWHFMTSFCWPIYETMGLINTECLFKLFLHIFVVVNMFWLVWHTQQTNRWFPTLTWLVGFLRNRKPILVIVFLVLLSIVENNIAFVLLCMKHISQIQQEDLINHHHSRVCQFMLWKTTCESLQDVIFDIWFLQCLTICLVVIEHIAAGQRSESSVFI